MTAGSKAHLCCLMSCFKAMVGSSTRASIWDRVKAFILGLTSAQTPTGVLLLKYINAGVLQRLSRVFANP